MIINVARLLMSDGLKIDINSTIELQPIEFGGAKYTVPRPIKVVGSIQNVEGVLHFNVQVSGKIETKCYRCTKEVQKDFSYEIKETLKNLDPSCEEIIDESIYFQGNEIDIKDIIIDSIVINMPMKYLCSQQCKGLCPSCGINLNTCKCECEKENIDPRFKVLKGFFNTDD